MTKVSSKSKEVASQVEEETVSERYNAFYERLTKDGAKSEHIQMMHDWMRLECLEAEAKAARLFYRNSDTKPLDGYTFGDLISAITRRLFGLSTAIDGLRYIDGLDGETIEGVQQIMSDVLVEVRRFEAAYGAESGLSSKFFREVAASL